MRQAAADEEFMIAMQLKQKIKLIKLFSEEELKSAVDVQDS